MQIIYRLLLTASIFIFVSHTINAQEKWTEKHEFFVEDRASIAKSKDFPNGIFYGFINRDSIIVIEPIYSEASDFYKGHSIVSKQEEKNTNDIFDNGKMGLIDKEGSVIVNIIYDHIYLEENDWYQLTKDKELFLFKPGKGFLTNKTFFEILSYDEGYYSLKVNDEKFILIDTTGNEVPGFFDIGENPFGISFFFNEYASFRKNGESFYLSKSGEVIDENSYNGIEIEYSTQTSGIRLDVKNGKWGMLGSDDEVILDFEYDYIEEIGDNYYKIGMVKDYSSFRIFDSKKEIILSDQIPEIPFYGRLTNGFIRVQGLDSLFKYCDLNGNFIPGSYDSAYDFDETGMALVVINGCYFNINQEGAEIFPLAIYQPIVEESGLNLSLAKADFHKENIDFLDVSSNGNYFVSASKEEQKVNVWNSSTGSVLLSSKVKKNLVDVKFFTANIITLLFDKHIEIIDFKKGTKEILEFKLNDQLKENSVKQIWDVDISNCKKYIIIRYVSSHSIDHQRILFDIGTREFSYPKIQIGYPYSLYDNLIISENNGKIDCYNWKDSRFLWSNDVKNKKLDKLFLFNSHYVEKNNEEITVTNLKDLEIKSFSIQLDDSDIDMDFLNGLIHILKKDSIITHNLENKSKEAFQISEDRIRLIHSPSHRAFYCTNSGEDIEVWDYKEDKKILGFEDQYNGHVGTSPYLPGFTVCNDFGSFYIDLSLLTMKNLGVQLPGHSITFSPDSTLLCFYPVRANRLMIYDIKKDISVLDLTSIAFVDQCIFSKNGNEIFIRRGSNLERIDLASGKKESLVDDAYFVQSFTYSSKVDKIYFNDNEKIYELDLKTLEVQEIFKQVKYYLNSISTVQKVQENVLAFATANELVFFETNTWREIKRISTSNSYCTYLSYLKDYNLLCLGYTNGFSEFVDLKSFQLLDLKFSMSGEDYLFYDQKTNFFHGSKKLISELRMTDGVRNIPHQVFEASYNRLDELLAKYKFTDQKYQKQISNAIAKRKLNQGVAKKQNKFECRIINNLKYFVKESHYVLNYEVRSTYQQIEKGKVIVSVNGIQVVDKSILIDKEFQDSDQLNLQSGINEIEIHVKSPNGEISNVESVRINCLKPRQSNLYFVGLANDKYTNWGALNYTLNDVNASADLFTSFSKFESVLIDTFYNQNLNKSVLTQIEENLKKLKEDDYVIFYLAGHGFTDEEKAEFFFINYDSPLTNFESDCISYSDIEKVMKKTRARNRLVFIDACQSGNMDLSLSDAEKLEMKETNVRPILIENIRGTGPRRKRSKDDVETSFVLMEELFSNYNNNFGGVTITASAGTGFAEERGDLGHGVFTHTLLDAFKNNNADLNSDGNIFISELMQYLKGAVSDKTSNRQRVTAKSENVVYDIELYSDSDN